MHAFKQPLTGRAASSKPSAHPTVVMSLLFGMLLTLQLFATVASVPTSVLAQNSEVTTNMMLNNNKHEQQRQQQDSAFNTMMNKVKRSSTNDAGSTTTTNNPNMSLLDKKSSPEIVPASYNAPSQQREQQLQQQQQHEAELSQSAVPVYTLPSNNEIIAAVEAAAAAAALNQRELQQRQSQFYGNADDMDVDIGDFSMPAQQPQKRGINSQQQQYLYDNMPAGGGYGRAMADNSNGDYFNPYLAVSNLLPNDPQVIAVPNGYWTDDDSNAVYADVQDLQDLNDYRQAHGVIVPPATYRSSNPYDNLQNLLNTETYLESAAAPVPLTLQYAPGSRYYAGIDDTRNKRNSNFKYNKYADLRLKRDTKLTPADMIALVALVEAGERARHDDAASTPIDEGDFFNYPYADGYTTSRQQQQTSNGANYDYNAPIYDADAAEYATGAWFEPNYANNNNNNNNMDYFALPMNMERERLIAAAGANNNNNMKYGTGNAKYGNTGNNKRYMVAKRKRSLGKFLNEPVAKPSVAYTGEKYY